MIKKILVFISLLLMPTIVYATDANSSVYSGNNVATCMGSYQDRSISTDGDIYFSHCMEAKCSNHTYNIYYYDNNSRVQCSNGNRSPYFNVHNYSACSRVKSMVCNNGEITYCSTIVYYDCGRTSDGQPYNKPTTTKATTTRTNSGYSRTNQTTTTAKPESNTKLSSLKLSQGNIEFDKEKYEYEIEIEDTVKSINVTAEPEDSSSKVKVQGNNNLTNGSVIKIIVTGTDGKESIYSIKVNVKETKKLSSNANLKDLKIRNHDIIFNSNVTSYVVYIENNETELDIYEIEPVDETASVDINNNSNLTNGSKVEIVVKAEDGKTTKTYILDIKVKKKSNFIKVLFIIILILAILALAYYLYKKLVLSRSGEKYEYE